MYKTIILIISLLFLVTIFAGCSNAELEKAQSDNQALLSQVSVQNLTIRTLQGEIQALTAQLEKVKPPKYFENRKAIETWLNLVPKLGVSKDAKEWYQYGLYYQQRALEVGYIVSVAYWKTESGISVWNEVVTADGWVYYFSPDTLELKDTYWRIEMVSPEYLEQLKYAGSF